MRKAALEVSCFGIKEAGPLSFWAYREIHEISTPFFQLKHTFSCVFGPIAESMKF